MAYDLLVQCSHRAIILSIDLEMSTEKVMELISSHFDIKVDSFELQVYDDRYGRYIDFDDEYAEELREILPRKIKKKISGQVLFQEAETTVTVSTFNDPLSPSYVPANSPSSVSVLDDPRSTTPNIDYDVCAHENRPSSDNNAQFDHDNDFNPTSHIIFKRDVAPFQRSQYQHSDYHEDAECSFSKKKTFTIRIQGVKTDFDNKYASILPEIKLPLNLLQENRLTLVVALVIEEHNEEQVNWRLDNRKGFLRDDVETDAMHYNPLYLNIDRSNWANDGTFKLPLRMRTVSGNQVVNAGCIFYTLRLSAARKLHSADYQPNTSRLACVVADKNHVIQWNTFGLSNFMRPKIYTKRKVEEFNSDITNHKASTETALEIPDTSAPLVMKHTTETTYSLSRKPMRLAQEFIISLLGSNRTEMYNFSCEINHSVNPVTIFTEHDTFIEFLTHNQDQQVVVVLFNDLDETLISVIHNIPQIHSIYVFDTQNDKNPGWAKNWAKVAGIFSDIEMMHYQLKRITSENKSFRETMSMRNKSFDIDLNESMSHFMFREVLKNVLLQLQYNENDKQNFLDYSRTLWNQDPALVLVDECNKNYDSSSAILWYTKEALLYSLLNQALRQQDHAALVTIRYFMRDIHYRYNRLQFVTLSDTQIEAEILQRTLGFPHLLYRKAKRRSKTLNKLDIEVDSISNLYQHFERLHLRNDQTTRAIVYRGQAISRCELEKLKQNQNSLLSFNNFLCMSGDRHVSLIFAESARDNTDSIGVLFEILIDPSVLRKPFASLNCISYLGNAENEVLFTIGTVFLIDEVKHIGDRLWQVSLTSSDTYNKKLRYGLPKFRQKINNESLRLRNLCSLMIDMGELEKAEMIYERMPETELQDSWEELAYLYRQLGCIKTSKNDFDSALAYYQRALQIRKDNISFNSLELARLISSIGTVYKSIGIESKSIFHPGGASRIRQTWPNIMPFTTVTACDSSGRLNSSEEDNIAYSLPFEERIKIQRSPHVSYYTFVSPIYSNIRRKYDSLRKNLEVYNQKISLILTNLVEIYKMSSTEHSMKRGCRTTMANYRKARQIEETYFPLMHTGIANKFRLTAQQMAENGDIKDLCKGQIRSKTESEHFLGTMNELEWLDTYENAVRISYENHEHLKCWLWKLKMARLLDQVFTNYVDNMKFADDQSREKIKDYMKTEIDRKRSEGLVRAYASGGTGFSTKLNRDLTKIGSNFRFLMTKSLFNSVSLSDEALQRLASHTFTAILINDSLYKSYGYTGICYRGMRLTQDELGLYKTNNIVMNRPFLSTTREKDVAKYFLSADDTGYESAMCVYKVKDLRSSFRIENLSEFPEEAEVLIMPFTTFRVTTVDNLNVGIGDKTGPIRVIINLEECDLDPT